MTQAFPEFRVTQISLRQSRFLVPAIGGHGPSADGPVWRRESAARTSMTNVDRPGQTSSRRLQRLARLVGHEPSIPPVAGLGPDRCHQYLDGCPIRRKGSSTPSRATHRKGKPARFSPLTALRTYHVKRRTQNALLHHHSRHVFFGGRVAKVHLLHDFNQNTRHHQVPVPLAVGGHDVPGSESRRRL